MVVGEGENGSPFLDQIALRVIWAVLGQASGVGMTLFYGVGVGKVQGSQEVRGSEGEMARVGRNRRTRNWSFQFALRVSSSPGKVPYIKCLQIFIPSFEGSVSGELLGLGVGAVCWEGVGENNQGG